MTVRDPAPFERARVGVARWLFIHAPLRSLAVALVPPGHPWRTFFESSWPDVEKLTRETLVPRVDEGKRGKRRRSGAMIVLLVVLAVAGATAADAAAVAL